MKKLIYLSDKVDSLLNTKNFIRAYRYDGKRYKPRAREYPDSLPAVHPKDIREKYERG